MRQLVAPRTIPSAVLLLLLLSFFGPLVGCAPTMVGANPAAVSASNAEDLQRLKTIALERAKIRPAESYAIGPGDLLEINVFDLDEMNRTVRVGSSGFVQLPLIGAVQATGKSEPDLAQDVAERLEKEYLQNPQVYVFVKEFNSQQVAVTGAVAQPGVYPLTRDRYTLLDMISRAGGLTKEAGRVVEFVPAADGKESAAFEIASAGRDLPIGIPTEPDAGAVEEQSISIDLNMLLRGGNRAALNLPVAGGDVIFVPEAGSFTVEGWVDKPGTYPLTRNTTALAALSTGGGALMPARLTRVQILRTGNDGQTREILEIDLKAIGRGGAPDMPLHSGDVVRVPAHAALVPVWGFYALLKNLVNIGASFPIL